MNLKEALRENEQLKKMNKTLQNENEKILHLLFKANKKLNDILKEKENVLEKYTIEHVKTFIPKTEVIKAVIINETETLVKEKKARKEKSKNFTSFDFECTRK